MKWVCICEENENCGKCWKCKCLTAEDKIEKAEGCLVCACISDSDEVIENTLEILMRNTK